MKTTVLSLFDGIACGRVALERAGIEIDEYYASEIDTNAIQIAKHNYPSIIEVGDVRRLCYNAQTGILSGENGIYHIGHVDLLIGGSPCTDLSSIGYARGMVSGGVRVESLSQYLQLKDAGAEFEGQSYLFWEYVRLLEEIKPDHFLLENVIMKRSWRDMITDVLGVSPVEINSSLVSAQNRPRVYWTDIDAAKTGPDDKNIDLIDILDEDADKTDVSSALTVQRRLPVVVERVGKVPKTFNPYNASVIDKKAPALSRGSMVTSSCATCIFVPVSDGIHIVTNGELSFYGDVFPCDLPDGRYNLRKLSIKEMERLQTLPDGYTSGAGVSDAKCRPIIGNGWTVDVITWIFKHINRGVV